MTFWLLFFGLATVGEGAFAFFHYRDTGPRGKDFILSTAFGTVFLICAIAETVRLYG